MLHNRSGAPERKSDMVRRLVSEGNYKAALRLASNFRIGITPEDHEAMKRGYEAMSYPDFFISIGIDPIEASKMAVQTVKRLYG